MDHRDEETISEGLFATPPRTGQQQSQERKGINARSNVSRLIGQTPLIFLNNLTSKSNATVICKLGGQVPTSGADRVAHALLRKLEDEKQITPGKTTLVEPSCTAGSGLSFLGAVKGYKVVLVIPENTPVEKRAIARAYGAELIVTPAAKGIKGAVYKAQQIVQERPNAVLFNPAEDLLSVTVHRDSTGAEIWEDTHGLVDVFVAPVSSGATITGVAQCLKAQNPAVKIVAVEPSESPVLSGGKPGPHKLQGMGLGVVPPLLDMELVDEIFKVSSEQGLQTARLLAKKEGILADPASGAAAFAALEIAKRPDMHGKLVVVMLSATGDQHLSTLYEEIRRQCQSLPIARESEFKNMPRERLAKPEKGEKPADEN